MNAMDYRRELVLLLAQIEKEHDVNSLTYKGVRIWPMLRSRLGSAYEDKWIAAGRHAPHHIARSLWHRYVMNRSIQAALHPGVALNVPPILDSDEPIANAEGLLFFSRRVRHFQTKDGRFTDHQDDCLFQLLASRFSCLKIEAAEPHTRETIPRVVEPVVFETPWKNDFNIFKERFAPHFSKWDNRREIEDFLNSARLLLDLEPESVDIENIERMLNYCEANAQVHLTLLKALRPRAIFIGMWLANETMGLIAAAKRLGIPTVEIQHGLIGRYQWFQTHYTRIPEEGYELLPDYFWVWDECTKDDTEREMPTVPGAHRALVGGNPALETWASDKGSKLAPIESAFLDGLKRWRRVVLVALQYYSLAPETIVQSIQEAPSDWLWLIRLHPMSRPMQDVVTDIYRSHGLDNVEVFYATELPLYDLLMHVDHVVTPFSTVALEAPFFGLPVTFTDSISVDLFSGFASADVVYADTAAAVCARIETSQSRESPSVPTMEPRAVQTATEILKDWNDRVSETDRRIEALSALPFFAEPDTTSGATSAHHPPSRTPAMDHIVGLAQATLSENVLHRLTPLARGLRRVERRLLKR